MRTVGDKDRFAVAFELRPDPDAAGSAEQRASWAAFQIWVAGRNLTQGTTASGEAVDAAEVPLAPILRWLVEVWDPLLCGGAQCLRGPPDAFSFPDFIFSSRLSYPVPYHDMSFFLVFCLSLSVVL